jgi:hypothetical protein
MALMEGPAKATILKNYLEQDGKSQTYVNLKLGFQGEDQTIYTRIYITKAAAGIARAKLRKCGFDLDTQKLSEIEDNDVLLLGHEVDVMLVKNGQYMNADIPTKKPKIGAEALGAAQAMLDSAKKSDSEEEEADIPF